LDCAKGWVSKRDLSTCDLVSLAENMGGSYERFCIDGRDLIELV